MKLPEKFIERMKRMPELDSGAFLSAMDEPPVGGIRLNRIKCGCTEDFSIDGFTLTPLSYIDTGFIYEGEGIGNTPEHHAGIIYSQDPGAMAALAAVDIPRGASVADLCAAPGGKASFLAEAVGEGGFLLANEYVPKRAKIIVSNFERLGIGNAIVTSLDTGALASMFESHFDLVLLDVPCSGEGMFRKSAEALRDWSEETVHACAARAKGILDNGARLVAPGGHLLFSTCTYAVEENEAQVLSFLESHPDFHIVSVKPALAASTEDGIAIGGNEELRKTRRCYPHVTRGEGQYIALLKRDEGRAPKQTILYKDSSKPLTRDEESAVKQFFLDTVGHMPRGSLRRVGENLVLIPHSTPIPSHGVFASGILLGEVRGNMLHPSHHLTMVLGGQFKNKEELSGDPARLASYLKGQEIFASCPDMRGFVALTYKGATLGLGKASGGVIKNHYPKGLRLK